MTKEASQVREFMIAAKQELPDRPTMPDLKTRILRAKLMLEECLEAIHDGLGLSIEFDNMQEQFRETGEIDVSKMEFREIHPGSLEKIADGCADLKVVTIGTDAEDAEINTQVFGEYNRQQAAPPAPKAPITKPSGAIL